jgi:hypothetical protein
MDDHARALLQYRREKSAIEPNGGEEIRVEGVLAIVVGQRQRAAAQRRGAATLWIKTSRPPKRSITASTI